MDIKKITDYLYHSNLMYGKILYAIIQGWKLVLALPLLFSIAILAYMSLYSNEYILVAQINQNYSEKMDLSAILIDLKDSSNFNNSVKQICDYKANNSKFNALVNSIAIKKISTSKYSVTLNLSSENLDHANECSQVMLLAIKDFYIKYYRNEIDKNIFIINNNNILTEEVLKNINSTDSVKSYVKINFLNEIILENFKLNRSNLYLEKSINNINISNINIFLNKSAYGKNLFLGLIFGLILAVLIVAKKEILITLTLFWKKI